MTEEFIENENDFFHPWNRFLFARFQMIRYLMQQGVSDEEIARRLSLVDGEHVRAIVNAMDIHRKP